MVDERNCPNCGRGIPLDARVCPYCKKEFEIQQYQEIKKHTRYGTASLVIGIIGIATIWLTFIPVIALLYLSIHIPLGINAIILGGVGYWGKSRHDSFCIAGFILGLLVLIIGFIGLILAVVISL